MTRLRFLLALVAVIFAAPASASDEELTIVNRTGYVISEIYISPTRTDNWEEDIMGREVLGNGERVVVDFSRSEDACLWDMLVIYEDEEEVSWDALNLCELATVVLNYNDRTGETWATTD
jgi:hypothetical protein